MISADYVIKLGIQVPFHVQPHEERHERCRDYVTILDMSNDEYLKVDENEEEEHICGEKETDPNAPKYLTSSA